MFLPDEFFRMEEFLDFLKSKEASLYFFLRSYVVRDSRLFDTPYYHPAYGLYKKFFTQGMLVARYPQKVLANRLKTDLKRIKERLLNLERMGFIKKIKIKYGKQTATYYQLGTWEGEPGDENNYTEVFFLDMYFDKLVSKQTLTEQNYEGVTVTPSKLILGGSP